MVKSGFAPLGLGRSVSRRFQWALECPRTISRPRACARPRWRRDNLKVIATGESDIQLCETLFYPPTWFRLNNSTADVQIGPRRTDRRRTAYRHRPPLIETMRTRLVRRIWETRTYIVLGADRVRQPVGPIAELVLEYLPARRVLHQPRYLRSSVRASLMRPVEYELRHGEIVGDEWGGLLRVELHRGGTVKGIL